MTWRELILRTATRAGLPPSQVRSTMTAMVEEVLDALSHGEQVHIKGIGMFGSRFSAMRSVRSVSSRRRIMLDARFVPRFRASARVRRVLAERTPQRWRSPQHQQAWQVAEALISDLALYHSARAPVLRRHGPLDAVEQACQAAFGPIWTRVSATYAREVPAEVRADTGYLQQAAMRRWGRDDAP